VKPSSTSPFPLLQTCWSPHREKHQGGVGAKRGGRGALAAFPVAGVGEQSWQTWETQGQGSPGVTPPILSLAPSLDPQVLLPGCPLRTQPFPFVGCEHAALPSKGRKVDGCFPAGRGRVGRMRLQTSKSRAGRAGRGGGDGKIRALLTAYVERGERTFPQPELERLQSIWELGRLPTDILHL